VTITGDTYAHRDGTHEIVGLADDGSSCSPNLSEPTYTAVAWYDDAPIGKIHRFSVSVPSSDIPTEDGTTTGIEDGGVSFDFVSASGIGTQYTGAAGRPNEGSSTINVTRSGDSLIFDFEGQTYVSVMFAGEMICADG
jgi:hypothetical protein